MHPEPLTSRRLSYLIAILALILLSNTYFATAHTVNDEDIFPDLYEASVQELQHGMDAGHFTCVDLVKAYFARINEVNLRGPSLRAVLELNPSALSQASALDHERKIKGKRGPLHGIPILLKDNIATVAFEGMNTTAGSYSLLGSIVPDDATIVKKFRSAGAIILGKASMSEWAQYRGNVPSGWSGRGGQCTSAYFPGADPCASSAGSGVAASIGLATITIGTETNGSITCPASYNNVVGIKPTVGLTSRTGGLIISPCSMGGAEMTTSSTVIPLSIHQDTIGPLTRSIADAALVLSIIAGKDPMDNYTLSQPSPLPNYTQALNKNAFKNKRIGVPRHVFLNISDSDSDPFVRVEFEKALDVIRNLGATVIDPADIPSAEEILKSGDQTIVVDVDFKVQLNKWFESLLDNPSGVRSLADLVKFNNDNPELEEPSQHEDQSLLIEAEATKGFDDTYFAALAADHDLGSTRGIDAVLKRYQLDALVLPATGFMWTPPAIVGYPIVTVPLGFFPENVTIRPAGPDTVYPAPGVPFGLAFFGTAFSDFDLIGFGYAYEQATKTRLARKAYAAAIPKIQLKDIVSK